jgi:urease accessory protein
MRICMGDSLLKLATWLSPAFPVGAFSYSHGLEYAIHSGAVVDRETAQSWIEACLREGAGRNDAILLSHTLRGGEVEELDALARAFAPSRKRLLETEAQGAAFARTQSEITETPIKELAYPVAIGFAARQHGCPERETLTLYLQAFSSNLVSACIRLVPIGQNDGQKIIAALYSAIGETADEAMSASLDDLGGCVMTADIASMRHETQSVRLFRS